MDYGPFACPEHAFSVYTRTPFHGFSKTHSGRLVSMILVKQILLESRFELERRFTAEEIAKTQSDILQVNIEYCSKKQITQYNKLQKSMPLH